MTTDDRDVPQTAEDAVSAGWVWLAIRCTACKHRRELPFRNLVGCLKLASLAKRLYCSRCGSHSMEMALGAFEHVAGQPWPRERVIELSGKRMVRPARG